MRRWGSGDYVENPLVDAFIEDVLAVCAKHGYSISHEDGHGAFEIEKFSEDFSEWLRNAHDKTGGNANASSVLSPTNADRKT